LPLNPPPEQFVMRAGRGVLMVAVGSAIMHLHPLPVVHCLRQPYEHISHACSALALEKDTQAHHSHPPQLQYQLLPTAASPPSQ
jgi:hypothetical protein